MAGVSHAVNNVNTIIGPALVGMDPTEQKEIDDKMVKVCCFSLRQMPLSCSLCGLSPQTLDGVKNEWGWHKSKLGANAILGVSMAVCKAGAASNGLPLYKHIAEMAGNPTDKMYMPVPAFNVINGGRWPTLPVHSCVDIPATMCTSVVDILPDVFSCSVGSTPCGVACLRTHLV